jgi:hypothetical protein
MPPAYDFPLFALKFNLVTSNSALRIIVPRFAILLMTAIIAISLCNWMLPEARLADQHTGRDREGSTSGLVVIAAGCALLFIVPAMAVLLFPKESGALQAPSVAFCIFPLVLAST